MLSKARGTAPSANHMDTTPHWSVGGEVELALLMEGELPMVVQMTLEGELLMVVKMCMGGEFWEEELAGCGTLFHTSINSEC